MGNTLLISRNAENENTTKYFKYPCYNNNAKSCMKLEAEQFQGAIRPKNDGSNKHEDTCIKQQQWLKLKCLQYKFKQLNTMLLLIFFNTCFMFFVRTSVYLQ